MLLPERCDMAAERMSVTVNREIYEQFEALRMEMGQGRSEAVEQAIRLWVKHLNEMLMAEGCSASKEEDLALAKACKKTALKAISRNL
jgi:metal-responsive CopG/Arc/MetJ family transcriptional regulator